MSPRSAEIKLWKECYETQRETIAIYRERWEQCRTKNERLRDQLEEARKQIEWLERGHHLRRNPY